MRLPSVRLVRDRHGRALAQDPHGHAEEERGPAAEEPDVAPQDRTVARQEALLEGLDGVGGRQEPADELDPDRDAPQVKEEARKHQARHVGKHDGELDREELVLHLWRR